MSFTDTNYFDSTQTELHLRLAAYSAEVACLKHELSKLKDEYEDLRKKLIEANSDNNHLVSLVTRQVTYSNNLCALLAAKNC